jgi:S1-C subfamily serine protease
MNHGDIILAVAGQRVKTRSEFEQAIAQFEPRTVVYLTVRRGEMILQLPVRLTYRPDIEQPEQQAKAPDIE